MSMLKPIVINRLVQKAEVRVNTPMQKPKEININKPEDANEIQEKTENLKSEVIATPIKRSSSINFDHLINSWVNDVKKDTSPKKRLSKR